MRVSHRNSLPLVPLLRAYTDAGLLGSEELGRLPGLGSRSRAVLAARDRLLSEQFLDTAGADDFQAEVVGFYAACVTPPLHATTLARRAGVVRHALTHLRRGVDPLPQKLERCLAPGAAYHVPGLGPAFWSAAVQVLDPWRHPAWTQATMAGLRRLGLAGWSPQDGPARIYTALQEAYARLRTLEPTLTALHCDHFLALVAGMVGRELWSGTHGLSAGASADVAEALRRVRAEVPLRRRLREGGAALEAARDQLDQAVAAGDGHALRSALAAADPVGARCAPVPWKSAGAELARWVRRLRDVDDPYPVLDEFWRADPVRGAGLWLPAAVLHLRDPRRFAPWNEAARQGYAGVDDGTAFIGLPAEHYRLFNEGIARLRIDLHLHPLEAPSVLAALIGSRPVARAESTFGGFCSDSFRFLSELERHNERAWMEAQRSRYRFAVRAPLVELCQALASQYIEPVLCKRHKWPLEKTARSGRALTSICRNDFGKSSPYHTALWLTFCRRGHAGKRDDVQLFVRLDAAGLSYGLRVGKDAGAVGQRFRAHVAAHANLLFRALATGGALGACRFGNETMGSNKRAEVEFAQSGSPMSLHSPEDLCAWAEGPAPVAGRALPAEAALLRSADLVGEILITFDRLLPLLACALDDHPEALLAQRAGEIDAERPFSEADFCQATHLGPDWLRQARALLGLKRQLILQGVPGTGKTHVARCLARLLTAGRDSAVRLIPFHPAYSYEEFVEGIRVQSVEVEGRHEVTYPVSDGLLLAFATEAARCPDQPYVLLVDEINRGNLPRVFGELLYLLEYRDQSVVLPCSKRSFSLPANLYLIGTMNATDRSVAQVDQALRRRFSFLDMPPDGAVLRAWLTKHPPAAGASFVERVAGIFERVNARLRHDLGPAYQVGHSYFMVSELDEARLRVVWEHQVRPLLDGYFAGHPGGTRAYQLDDLLADPRPRRRKGTPARIAVP